MSGLSPPPPGLLLLASASPRRRDLLFAAAYRPTVVVAPVVESDSPHLTAAERVCLNARRKAFAGRLAAGKSPVRTVVLGADTLVSVGGQVLGKPRDPEEAFTMVSTLARCTHEVFTGVCLIASRGSPSRLEFVERTAVTFRPLDAGAIRAYLARINPLDKAGGYAAQEHGADIIASVEGSWTNVMGLPMETLMTVLPRLGIYPTGSVTEDSR